MESMIANHYNFIRFFFLFVLLCLLGGEFINRVRGVALMDGATGAELLKYRGGLWFKNVSMTKTLWDF